MLVVISPAKRLDWDPVDRDDLTLPDFDKNAMSLAKTARNLTLGGLRDLMDLSEDLAKLNRDRFKAFSEEPDADALRPAMYAFAGDTYQGLEAATLDDDDVAWAQDHLRILSGLYGVLRPLDQIQAYRLEMGSKLKTRRGKNLYDYWDKELSKALNAQAEEVGAKALINCASQEYFGAVDTKALKLDVITPQFLEEKDGKQKMVSFFAKKARGAMARFVVTQRVTDPDGIKDFDVGGYAYDAEQSTPEKPVFVRPYPDTKS
ncbi:peroxide stress protein YaaA [Shimia ponticola]|uniref:peroxide stress protein YaaA n=1 Tax=Shimia ponticola TaxID=2582893 RepID=UPI0011BDD5F2|nr:peroxide stress protein YaaA [Shimia ponticola]